MGPTGDRPERAVLQQVLADLARRHIIQWRRQPEARGAPLGPLVRCGRGRADVLVVLAPYGYVLALGGMGTDGTLSHAQRTLLDTLIAAGVVALIVHTQPWSDLVDQVPTGHVTQPASLAADAALVRTEEIAAASNDRAAYQEDIYVNG